MLFNPEIIANEVAEQFVNTFVAPNWQTNKRYCNDILHGAYLLAMTLDSALGVVTPLADDFLFLCELVEEVY